ncbi:MAG: transposase [Anaerolineaceae bacterium]
MDTNLTQVKQFRTRLYQSLPHRADATMDLIDALAGNTASRSVVELSLSPLFRRRHASVHDAIDSLLEDTGERGDFDLSRRRLEEGLLRAVAPELPGPKERPFWLMAIDALSLARPHAATLTDRSYVHKADAPSSGRPVAVGHAYSLLVVLPERQTGDPPWAPALSSRRIPSERTAADVAVEQLWDVMEEKDAPWAGQLVACVVDSGYGNAPFLADAAKEPELVTIVRLRSNRVVYQPPQPVPGRKGRPPWYGERFDLGDKTTWTEPQTVSTFPRRTSGGRDYTVEVRAWPNMRMKGAKGFPMHSHPCKLLRVECLDEAGKALFRRPLWLGVVGVRRSEVTPEQAHDAYRQRFDQEHSHRFLRQRLLLDAFQTPETQHEENYVVLVRLAYVLLFVARTIAQHLPRPWERAKKTSGPASPTMVQRDLARILAVTGTPACEPKPRGKSKGRTLGVAPGRRTRHKVVYKGQSHAPRARAPAA